MKFVDFMADSGDFYTGLIDFSFRFCYNGMELFDKSAQTGDIEK